MAISQSIIDFANLVAHHHVIFCREIVPELSFVNVGVILSEMILDEGLDSPMLNYATDDFIQSILSRQENHAQIGAYLALTNIGILFEPTLSFNIPELLKNYSRNKVLIIHTQAIIQNDVLHYLHPSDNITADLRGLQYIIL